MTAGAEGCRLGHTQKAMECPGCAEANGSETTPEWWRWYRSRTSSKTVKEAIDVITASRGGGASTECPAPTSPEPGHGLGAPTSAVPPKHGAATTLSHSEVS